MPRYRVCERRALHNFTLIDAESEEAATKYDGDVLDECETDTWGEELVSCEEVPGDTEYAVE